MKKFAFILLLAIFSVQVFAQSGASIFVSARGNDINDGLSESTPLKSLDLAVVTAILTGVNKVTVIGTLTMENGKQDGIVVFRLMGLSNSNSELLITGKPNAPAADRAVLTGRGSGKATVMIIQNNIRFEHIEITGGEGELPVGIVVNNSRVVLGQGVLVRNNQNAGVFVPKGTCIIDGGEVCENMFGIAVLDILIMQSGYIRNNGPFNGAGVGVRNGGQFTMTGGTITGNRAASYGGGVAVQSGGRFDQTGGTISGNTAPQSPNVYRQSGSLGSNL
jgi:hypothetical protein